MDLGEEVSSCKAQGGLSPPDTPHLPEEGFCYVGTLNLLRWGQTSSDRDHIETHTGPHIGEHVSDKMVELWQGLRWFKEVLVAILGPSLQAPKSL